MGIDYSLCSIIKRTDATLLIENLRAIVDPISRDRLTLDRWLPATQAKHLTSAGETIIDDRGIANIELSAYESINSYCFSLHLQLETEFKDWFSDNTFDCFNRPGSFGCMWTSIYADREYLFLQMTAATSDMSRVIERSSAVRDLWIGFAQKTRAMVAYIDIEAENAIQLFPHRGTLVLPEKDDIFAVDRFMRQLPQQL